VNTRFIETFVVLAQLRNFRATARALHATPAAISLRIKSLEDELGTELIDRSATEFRLTPNAEHLLSYAKSVVNATRALQTAAGREGEVFGRLRLGVIESVVHSWLAYYVEQLRASYPELEIDLNVEPSSVLEKRLRARELDLVLQVDGINSNEIVSDALALYEVRWIARKGLLSASKEGLVKRVLEWPILTFGRGTTPQRMLTEIVETLANQAGVPIEQTRITCSHSVAAIIQLIRDGYGVAAIPSLFVADYLDSGQFVTLPVNPVPPSIVVSLCLHANAEARVHAAANVARLACAAYCAKFDQRHVEALC
jgi:DNA-binding transcriptional LysR family regulator